jgi:hypothetical protein
MRRSIIRIARALAVVCLLGTSSCGQEFHTQYECRMEAGPEPGVGLLLFGLVGGLAMASMPDHQEWQREVDACVKERHALQPAHPT